MAWSRRFIPKLFVWHSSRDIVRMNWRYNRTGLYTEKKISLVETAANKKGFWRSEKKCSHWLKQLERVDLLFELRRKRFRRSSRSKRNLFVCREGDSEIWWKSLQGRRDEMECELEREQRTCLDCNVRRIGRCEDVDRWPIGDIVGHWWPLRGGEGFLFINQFGCTSTSFWRCPFKSFRRKALGWISYFTLSHIHWTDKSKRFSMANRYYLGGVI